MSTMYQPDPSQQSVPQRPLMSVYGTPYNVMPQSFPGFQYMNYPYMPNPYQPQMNLAPTSYQDIHSSPGSDSKQTEPKNDSGLVENLRGEVQKLQEDLKNINGKYNTLKESSNDQSSIRKIEDLEEKLRENTKKWEEKLKRSEIDFKVSEDMLKSEIEGLQKRNEVR